MTRPDQSGETFDRRLTRWLRPGAAMIGVGKLAIAGWQMVRPLIVRGLEVLLALILIFEEWGWRPLASVFARLRRLKLWAMFEDWLQTLPPYPSLLAFALPSVLLFPLKLASLWLIARGHVVAAGMLFVAAKVIGTAIVARLFVLLQPKLMAIGWFARAYHWLMPWKETIYARIRASWPWRYGRVVRSILQRRLARLAEAWRPTLAQWLHTLRITLAEARHNLKARLSEVSARIRAAIGRAEP